MNPIQREVLLNAIKVEEYHLKMLRVHLETSLPNKQRRGWVTAISLQEQWVKESEERLAALWEGMEK